jgi:hypothetical protein
VSQHGSAKWPRLCPCNTKLGSRLAAVSQASTRCRVSGPLLRGPTSAQSSTAALQRLRPALLCAGFRSHRTRRGPAYSHCRLTPRSSGAPTAGHQARAGGTRYIFTGPGLAPCRRRPLTSNVRRQRATMRHASTRLGQVASPLSMQYGVEFFRRRCDPGLYLGPYPGPAFTRAYQLSSDHRRTPASAPGAFMRRVQQSPHTPRACILALPPNPSVKRSANGRPPSPGRWYAVHFHRPGLGALPSSPAYLER